MSTDVAAKKSERSGRAERTIEHLSPAERVAVGRRPARRCRGARTPSGSRTATAPTPSSCSRNRPRPGCRSWCRSATAGCSSRRSRSTAARRYLMASDLAATPRTGLHVQLCGDAHLSNFGAFAAPDRRLVFSVNDFDETLPGPFEWDVKRLVASFAVAGRTAASTPADAGRDQPTVGRGRTARRCGSSRAMRHLDLWYARLDVEEIGRQLDAGAAKVEQKRSSANAGEGADEGQPAAFGKLTAIVDGEPRIVSDPPLIVPIDELLGAGEAPASTRRPRRWIRSYRRTLQGDRRHLLERSATSTAPARSSASAASAPGRGSC